MFIQRVHPCRFNYLKKRIEEESELLPLFENNVLTKSKNVSMLAIYIQDPVIYTVTECAKIIYLNKTKKMPHPKQDSRLHEILDAFFELIFFDLMIAHFENMVLCMSRIEHQKWKMSVLISKIDKQSVDKIIKRPNILIEKYKISEQNGFEFFEVLDQSQKKYITNSEIVKPHSNGETVPHPNYQDAHVPEKVENKKKSFFCKIKEKFVKTRNEEHEDSKMLIDPGYILLGQKKDDVIIIQRKKLCHPFTLRTTNDLKFLQNFFKNDLFFLEIDCALKIILIKEQRPAIFIYSEVKEFDCELSKNIESLEKFSRKFLTES